MKDLNLKKLIGSDSGLRMRLAQELWPEASRKSQEVSISQLITGKKKTLKIEWVVKICDVLDKDPNTLFGYPWRKKVVLKKKY